MTPALQSAMERAGLAASVALKESGVGGAKPVSYTADPAAHVRVIIAAALSLLPQNLKGEG